MLIDESKMAVDSSFSCLNLRKQHTNLKLKLVFEIETQNPLTEQNRSIKTSYDRPDSDHKRLNRDGSGSGHHYTLSRSTNSDCQLYGYTNQPQIHKFGKPAYKTNI